MSTYYGFSTFTWVGGKKGRATQIVLQGATYPIYDAGVGTGYLYLIINANYSKIGVVKSYVNVG